MNIKKTCFKCKKEKFLKEFYKHNAMTDGHLNKCKDCSKKDAIKHRRGNAEKVRAYDRERSSLPHRIAAVNKYAKTKKGKQVGNRSKQNYSKQHPVEKKASQILNNAIQNGRIKKEPCEKCGSTKRIHGHHDDYIKPLDVKWLCPKCHSNLHKEKRNN